MFAVLYMVVGNPDGWYGWIDQDQPCDFLVKEIQFT